MTLIINGKTYEAGELTAYVNKLEKENAEIKNNNKIYCEGNGETLVVNVSFDSFTRINANHKMYYPHNEDLEKENAELKDKLEITDLALDNCLKDSEVEEL